jgi:hypothetical protein
VKVVVELGSGGNRFSCVWGGGGVLVYMFSLLGGYPDAYYRLWCVFMTVSNMGFGFSVNCSFRWLPVLVNS